MGLSHKVGVVIVGAGHAGYQTAESLRREGYEEPIVLIGDEPYAPYHRPPLSKAYLLGQTDKERLKFRTVDYYLEHGIDLWTLHWAPGWDCSWELIQAIGGGRGRGGS